MFKPRCVPASAGRQALFLVLLAACVQAAPARQALEPLPEHREAVRIILYILEHYHYSKPHLDDELSGRIFDRYLDLLDPSRLYLTAEDLQEFSEYRDKLDNALRASALEPAFNIFKRYRQRVDERVRHALELLERDYDFSREESFIFDRSEQPRATDAKALDEIWRKRVKNDLLTLRLADKEADEIPEVLQARYEQLRKSAEKLRAGDVFQLLMNAFATAIDPHSAYLSPRTAENFDINMRLSLEGIGAVLFTNNMDMTEIRNIITGGPAARSGELEAEDRIVGVGQGSEQNIVDVIGWRLDDVVDLIRGPKGSVVRLEVLPKEAGLGGLTRIVRLVRDAIKLEENAVSTSVLELAPGGPRVGILDIPSFYIDFTARSRNDANYRSTTRDVRRELRLLAGEDIDGLLVDLRGNGGGSLEEAEHLTGLFIPSGPVVQTRDSRNQVEIKQDPDPALVYSGPLAVLVDRYSASASEIFSAAIQDYRRGLIIGETTFGKGTVQNIVDLNRFYKGKDLKGKDLDLGRLKLTIAQFYRINGGSNQFRGVRPDVPFPAPQEQEVYGERAFKNALPWDTIRPADYLPVRMSGDDLYDAAARGRHLLRIAGDEEFTFFRKEQKYLYDIRSRKSISLNEDLRRAEHTRQSELRENLERMPEHKARLLRPLPGKEDETERAIDFFLYESARILSDLSPRAPPPGAA